MATTYGAPTGLDLSACTFSNDGNKTSSSGSDLVTAIASNASAIATAASTASDAKTTAEAANQTAAQAETDAQTAISTANTANTTAGNAVPKSQVTVSGFDAVVGGIKGTIVLGAQPLENNAANPTAFPGQGPIMGWNDSTTQCATLYVNINPGQGTGGHRFFERNTGFNSTGFDVSDYSAAWNHSGSASFGQRGLTCNFGFGRKNSNQWQILKFYTSNSSYVGADTDEFGPDGGDTQIIARGGDGKAANGELAFNAGSLTSFVDGTTELGSATNRFNNLYLSGTVNQTSDANEKTVIGKVEDPSYADSSKLLALYEKLTPIVYQYNSAIAEKGAANARYHIGNIAQDVQAAFIAVGLDPSKWSIWSEEVLTEQVRTPVVTKKTINSLDENGKPVANVVEETTYTYETKPVLDSNGQQKTRQALNYIDLLMLYTACAQSAITSQQTALAALTVRVSALESK